MTKEVGTYEILSPIAGSWILGVTAGLALKRIPIAEAGKFTGAYGSTVMAGGVRSIRVLTASGAAVLADNGGIVEMNVAAADPIFTIPKDTFPVGATLEVVWKGVGQPLIAPVDVDVTILSADDFRRIGTRYDMAYMYMSEANIWILTGGLIA